MSDIVVSERHGNVLVIRIQRPAKRNSIDRATADALDEALNTLDDDETLWVGVLTGTDQFFSAGSDLTSRGDYVTERGGEYGLIRRQRTKPLIAAVEGFALGGGMEIVLSCDMVVAARDARFGLPEVGIGLIPTCAGLFRAPQSLPLNLAREMILTGDPISAERAHAAGLVNLLVDPGAAVDGALGFAARICRNAPVSVQACLAAVNGRLAADADDDWARTDAAKSRALSSEDAAEGVRSFLEKRPPVWKGR